MEYKVFQLNKHYKFDFNGNSENSVSNPNSINICIENYDRIFTKKWLGLITHYEIDLPLNEVLKINFIECTSKVLHLKCQSLMVLTSPIEFGDGFRLIPGFPGFIINKNGLVKSRKTGRTLKQAIGPYGYPYVNIYDPDKTKWRSVSLHILLARAFIKNNSPEYYYFVNHKDGNKLNYRLNNLEWVNSRENNLHAVNNNLRNDNNPCKVKDLDTGIIRTYQSISLALNKIGLLSKYKKISRNIGSVVIPVLFLNRYEIKLNNDLSDWYYSNINRGLKYSLKGPYQVLEIESKIVSDALSIKELVLLTNISEERILTALRSDKLKNCDGYVFRVKSENEWCKDYDKIVFHPARSIIARNINTLEEIKFNSIRQLTKKLSIDKRTLKSKLNSNKDHNGWLFVEK